MVRASRTHFVAKSVSLTRTKTIVAVFVILQRLATQMEGAMEGPGSASATTDGADLIVLSKRVTLQHLAGPTAFAFQGQASASVTTDGLGRIAAFD